MTGTDIVVILIVAVIFTLALRYIIKAKKNGAKCIGCPSGGCCCSENDKNKQSASCCGCQSENDK